MIFEPVPASSLTPQFRMIYACIYTMRQGFTYMVGFLPSYLYLNFFTQLAFKLPDYVENPCMHASPSQNIMHGKHGWIFLNIYNIIG